MSCIYFRDIDVKEQFVAFITKKDADPDIHVDASDIKDIDDSINGVKIHGLKKLQTRELLARFENKYQRSWVLRVDEDTGFYTIGYFSSDGNYFPNYHTCNKYGIAVDRSGYFYDPIFDSGKFIQKESSWSYITENFDIYAWEEV